MAGSTKTDDLQKMNEARITNSEARIDSFEQIYKSNVNKNRWMVGIVVALAGLAVNEIISNQKQLNIDIAGMKVILSEQSKQQAVMAERLNNYAKFEQKIEELEKADTEFLKIIHDIDKRSN